MALRRSVQHEVKSLRLSHAYQLVLAFFLGGAVSSLAQDPSDFVFFWAQSQGYTSTNWSVSLWYYVPFFLYITLFLVGLGLAVTRLVGPLFMIYLYLALIISSAVFSLFLPQSTSAFFVATVILGTFVSAGIVTGLFFQIRRS